MVFVPALSGFYGSQGQHPTPTGVYTLPQGYQNGNQSAFTVTLNRLYYIPFAVKVGRTFAGVAVSNNDTAANGQKCRIMAFNAGPTGPSTLAKDFGEITFTGAAAATDLLSSWAALTGLYWMGVWFNSATVMDGMAATTTVTQVGFASTETLTHIHGKISASAPISSTNQFQAHYVDTAYGSAPANAVAPTATLVSTIGTTSMTVPAVWIKS